MSTAEIIEINSSRRRRVVLSHVPQIPDLHVPWYGSRERQYLRSLFSEPLEYVDHDLFAKPSAEKLIFGTTAGLAENAARFEDQGDDGSCGLDRLGDGETPSAGQETLLFQRLNYARMRLAHAVCRLVEQPLPIDALRDLLAWGHRTNTYRDRLARLSLPLVPAMAKQSRFQTLDYNELASEGNCALVRAIMTFDCSRGYRFSTYACRAILKSFARVILRTTRYRNHFPVEFNPEQECGTTIDNRRHDDKLGCLSELKAILAKNRAQLTDIEQTVIRERFALDNVAECATPKTLDEIGEMIGVTKERVRQIQNKALAKLRHDMEKNYLAA